MKKGINKEIILKESEKMIKAHGVEAFSLRALSEKLGIKPASLYNHVSGIDEIYYLLAEKTAQDMKDSLENAIDTKPPDEAFVAGANAYRAFMENNRQMYLLFIKARPFAEKREEKPRLGRYGFSPLKDVIKTYGLSRDDFLHFIRCFRAFIHGFVEITHNGFMQKGPVPKDETYNVAINVFLGILKSGGRQC